MTTRTIHTLPTTSRIPAPHAVAAMLRGAWTNVATMIHASRTRRLLADMDQRMLADIGVGRGDALHEAGRPFWDIDTYR